MKLDCFFLKYFSNALITNHIVTLRDILVVKTIQSVCKIHCHLNISEKKTT